MSSTIDPKIRALVAINEALSALDHDTARDLTGDFLVDDARMLLMLAREHYTKKDWPELPHPDLNQAKSDDWVLSRLVEQRRDGRA